MKMIATKRFVPGLVAFALAAIAIGAAVRADAASSVRISLVYGGGGGASGYYNYDYVELFNNSGLSVVVPVGGWALMYGSATGTSFGSTSTNAAMIPAGTVIPACGYLLIQVGSVGSNVGAATPSTPDLTAGGPSMSATTGKLALVNNQTIPGPVCAGNVMGMEPSPIIDAVGWGPTANCYEVAVFPTATTNQQAIVRALGGATDGDNNSTDFAIVTSPTLRNSASPINSYCVASPTNSSTWGRVKTIYR